jgi:hypothetical protein
MLKKVGKLVKHAKKLFHPPLLQTRRSHRIRRSQPADHAAGDHVAKTKGVDDKTDLALSSPPREKGWGLGACLFH